MDVTNEKLLSTEYGDGWTLDDYEVGREQDSFDKQYVRNWLEEVVSQGDWDKTPPGPEVPADIVTNTLSKYQEAAARLFD